MGPRIQLRMLKRLPPPFSFKWGDKWEEYLPPLPPPQKTSFATFSNSLPNMRHLTPPPSASNRPPEESNSRLKRGGKEETFKFRRAAMRVNGRGRSEERSEDKRQKKEAVGRCAESDAKKESIVLSVLARCRDAENASV